MDADETLREASEYGDFTVVYARRNLSGRWVRDAKFMTGAGSVENAATMFAFEMGDAEVRPCAILRGQVKTVDDFEYADTPDVFSNPYASRLVHFDADRTAVTRRYTVLGCWDTGDGPRRYSKRVFARDAEHAELMVRRDLSDGEFLVAAVVKGHAHVADVDAVWATFDGEEPTALVEARRNWFPLIAACVVVLIVVAVFAVACS